MACPDPSCFVKVGDGRGFVVKQRVKQVRPRDLPRRIKLRPFVERRIVVTAGHCLKELPPAHAFPGAHDRVYGNLLGRLGDQKSTVWAECLFVDPVADIAVLGCPDDQELFDEAAAYDEFVENTPLLRVANAKRGPGWMLTLDGQWMSIELQLHFGMFNVGLEIDPTYSGQSGSPILDGRGRAVALVAVGHMTGTTQGETIKNERCGPQPMLSRDLPGWLLQTLMLRG